MSGAFGHPFQNDGACSGICNVCGNSAPEHEFVALNNGKKVIITGRLLLLTSGNETPTPEANVPSL